MWEISYKLFLLDGCAGDVMMLIISPQSQGPSSSPHGILSIKETTDLIFNIYAKTLSAHSLLDLSE